MSFNRLSTGVAGLVLCSLTPISQAAFVEDSKASILLQNYYFNSDYRDQVSSASNQQNKREEWVQGATFNFNSGFTEGTVGFGLDLLGMYAFKLDSGPERSGTGLLPSSSSARPGEPSYSRRAADNYAKLGVTGKVRYAKSELRIGTLTPVALPVLYPNTSRLFPQTFQGAEVQSRDVDNFVLRAGYVDRVKQRDSSDFEPMTLDTRNSRFNVSHTSADFRYLGGDYQFNPSLTLSYFHSILEDLYRQDYLGLKHVAAIGPGKLTSELRGFTSREDGAAYAGDIDNQMYLVNLMYNWGPHAIGGGYQILTGQDAFPMINGAGMYSPTEIMISNFSAAQERTWWARYDFDFASLGAPGLTFSTRYVSGAHAEIRNVGSAEKEWERDSEVAYAFPKTSVLNNLSVRVRNATYRSTFNRGIDHTRMIISYSIPLM